MSRRLAVVSSRRARRLVVVGLLLAVVVAGAHIGPTAPSARSVQPSGEAVLAAGFGGLPLYFIANAGQADPWADYYVHGDSTSVLFGPAGLSFRLWRSPVAPAGACPERRGRGLCQADWEAGQPPEPLGALVSGQRAGDVRTGTVDAVGLTFVGARGDARPSAEARTPTLFNYFHGPRAEWHTDVPTFGRLTYRDVWPDIDVTFEGTVQRLKHTFVIRPGADPAAIRLAWQGVSAVRVDADGALAIDTPGGQLRDEAPTAYQLIGGRRVPVTVRFALSPATGARWTYGFRLGAYDRAQSLYIDPAVTVWAGFIGGAGLDRGLGIALDPQGHVYVTGQTGPAAYVAKLTPDGRTLEWLSVIDGNGFDASFDIDVDAHGAAYITGPTASDDASFPVTGGPDLTFNGGFIDGFVAKLVPSGNSLEFAGYMGGAGTDFGEGIVVDGTGNVFLSGLAESSEASFPVVVGPDLTQNGLWDAYVLKLKPTPTAKRVEDNYAWAGFVGGAGQDVYVSNGYLSAGHIALDAADNVYMSGETTSTEATFPDGDGFGSLPGPDQTFNGGVWDAYIVKVRADGTGLAYAGYIGGAGYDEGKGMAIDANGAAYLTGATTSAANTFPVKVGPDLTANGGYDAFVAKVQPDGKALEFCGYLGGAGDDQGQGVKLGPDGALYIAGRAESDEASFPVTVGPDLTYNGPDDVTIDAGDAYIGRLAATFTNPDARRNWDFLGYIGGDQDDSAFWLDVDGAGNAYVVGDTLSSGDTFPDGDGFGGLTTWNRTNAGAGDAFVARVDWSPAAAPSSRALLPWAGQGAVRENAVPPVAVTLTSTATPRPTVTATPAATEAPTCMPPRAITPPAGEEIVFFDDFSDPNCGRWPTSDEPGATERYVDGEYELATDALSQFVQADAPDVRLQDGAIEVTLRLMNDDDAIGGVMFGPGQGPFLFIVDGTGIYRLAEVFGTHFKFLAGPTQSPYLAHGTAPNRLRVERNGRRIALLANGHLLTTVTDPALAEPGPVSLLLGSTNDVPTAMRFDDFLVTRWTASRPTPTDVPVQPTATSVPMPTVPSGPTVLFSDDFSNPGSGWLIEDIADDTTRYDAGEYEVAVHQPQYLAAPIAPRGQCANCTIDVVTHFVSSGLGLAGLVLGERGASVVDTFEITSDGRYRVQSNDGGTFHVLVNATASSAIKVGTGQKNHLRAMRQDGKLILVVNDVTLTTLDIPGLKDAGVGGLMAISTQTEVVARFDDYSMVAEREGHASLWPAVGALATRHDGGALSEPLTALHGRLEVRLDTLAPAMRLQR